MLDVIFAALIIAIIVAPFVVLAVALARAENRMYQKKKERGEPTPWI